MCFLSPLVPSGVLDHNSVRTLAPPNFYPEPQRTCCVLRIIKCGKNALKIFRSIYRTWAVRRKHKYLLFRPHHIFDFEFQKRMSRILKQYDLDLSLGEPFQKDGKYETEILFQANLTAGKKVLQYLSVPDLRSLITLGSVY